MIGDANLYYKTVTWKTTESLCFVLQANVMRATHGIVYGTCDRTGHTPLVPDVSAIDTTPKMNFQFVIFLQSNWILDGKEDRKPAKHAW